MGNPDLINKEKGVLMDDMESERDELTSEFNVRLNELIKTNISESISSFIEENKKLSKELEQTKENYNNYIVKCSQELNELKKEIEQSKIRTSQLAKDINMLEMLMLKVTSLQEERKKIDDQNKKIRAELNTKKSKLNKLKKELKLMLKESKRYKRLSIDAENSHSWRYTKIIRKTLDKIKSI